MATLTTKITFESLKEEIIKTFEILHHKLDERQQIVMNKLLAIKEEVERSTDLDEGIVKLKQAKEHAISTLKDNVIGKEKEAIEKTFINQIQEAETRKLAEKSCSLKLRRYINMISEGISKVDLIEEIPIYARKVAPFIKRGRIGDGKGEFNNPGGICIDNASNRVYIADAGNKRIQIVNSMDGEYVNMFGSDLLFEPWDVTTTKKFVYVTDEVQHNIVKFKKDGAFIKKIGSYGDGQLEFKFPRGITAFDDKIYVCDYQNHRIQVLDKSLKFIIRYKALGVSFPTSIHVTSDTIYLLPQADNIVHIFSRTCYRLLQTINLTGQEYNMATHFFFTVDKFGNFLVSARDECNIRIFDKSGALKQTLGDGYISHPNGIALDSNNNVICVTGDINTKFQIF